MTEKRLEIDEFRRLKLGNLSPKAFEQFFLHFFNLRPTLTVRRHGRKLTRQVISAELYHAASGQAQDGIDILLRMSQGDNWVVQCKRVKKWDVGKTETAIKKAGKFKAQFYLLIVACDPMVGVQDLILQKPDWEIWNPDKLAVEIRQRLTPTQLPGLLGEAGMNFEEIKRFAPIVTRSLVDCETFFDPFTGTDKTFRHDFGLVGREDDLRKLMEFAMHGAAKTMLLFAPGGTGKSRLLRELALQLHKKAPEMEVVFLNPHRQATDDPTPAFVTDERPRLLIVDDAHRTEEIPPPLLAVAASQQNTHILLATRPQGVEALKHLLGNVGLMSNPVVHKLTPLKKGEVRELAANVLETTPRSAQATKLVEWCGHNPFLVVLAGRMIRTGQFKPNASTTQDEFRSNVFEKFETENLRHLQHRDREARLLRAAAMLAPMNFDQECKEALAKCLTIAPLDVEDAAMNLKNADLLVGSDAALRPAPDLFADFLVFDTCFDPQRAKTALCDAIMRAFPASSAALLRNLSEALWMGVVAASADAPSLLAPLIEQEHERFLAGNYYERGKVIQRWASFSVFLPAETIAFARFALDHRDARIATPEDQADINDWVNSVLTGSVSRLDSPEYMLDAMPKMLGPVAKYHESHRWAALDLLWELALYIAWKRVANNQFHPLAVIADVLKPDLDKPVAVALDAAKWLRRKLEDPTAKEMIAGGLPVYTTLLGACLARLISWSRFEGGVTFSYGEAPVNTSIVEPVHRVAYEIIEQEIRIGPWNRAVKIWPVIQKSMLRGISKGEAGHGLLPKDWISARHEGIRLTKLLLEQHPHPWVRFTLKQHLLDSVRWDCTDDLTPDLCAIRASIFEDRDTRTITACRRESQWKFVEDTELGDDYAERLKRSEERWLSFLNDIACELADSQGALLREHLERIATTLELVQEQMHPQMLFHSLTTVRPQAAIQLASRLLQDGTASPLVDCWPVLVMDNTAITPLGQIDIARGFVHSGIPDARPAFFRHWTLRRRDIEQPNLPLNELLIEAAREASDEEALHILYRFKLIESKAFPWAWTLFETLPLERLVLSQVDEVFDALHRGDDETIEAPIEVVARVVKALRDISTWDSVVNAGHVHWLTQRHPRLLFDILFERIKHAEEQAAEYYPEMLPGGFGFTLSFDNLSGESDFPAICDSLWERVLNLDQPRRYDWIKLFQAVVLSASSGWLPRLMWCVKQADTEKTLSGLADILRFDGSMIVINEPALTREFLLRAESLGGAKLALDMRTELYASAGPKSWSFTDGARDDGYGYLESEARKAAETHANDDVLGPFYRWITEREEKDRLHMRLSYEAESAEMDL